MTALHIGCRNGQLSIVQLLLEHGALPDEIDNASLFPGVHDLHRLSVSSLSRYEFGYMPVMCAAHF